MLTVGLGHDVFTSSAAIAHNGRIVAAIPEERLNRQKQYKGFPALALKECLRQARATINDVDVVCVAWNPARHLEHANYRQSNLARWRAEQLFAIPNMLMGHFAQPSGEWIEQGLDGLRAKIVYVDHHLSHAANAFYLSGFDRAAVASLDGRGEQETAYFGRADCRGITKLGSVVFPHSLGLVYGAVTQYLGFKPDSDEWKVMALASYGEPGNPFYAKLRALVEVDEASGRFFVDQRYFTYHQPESYGGRFFSPDFVDLFGLPRTANGELEKRHMNMSWALQRVFEETMTSCLKALHARTDERRLVAAGGCMMNSVYNGKITRDTPFREAFVSSCPDDSGISVGAALLAYHRRADRPEAGEPPARHAEHLHNYWGPEYTPSEIESTLKAYKVPYERLSNVPAQTAALLESGKICGWFQGRMEFGPRALGNRSILLDPRRADGKDVVNRAVKYREGFRPFAPAILAEKVNEWFQAEGGASVPFMERVYLFREAMAARVPAVVHADGSGRLQTVVHAQNPRFYDLIQAFEGLTGVPIVLNTSFNLNGEPIVCSPTDAIRTFWSCGLDCLILGDFVVKKQG